MIHISGRRARHVIVLLLLALAGLPGAVPAARVADLYAASAPAPDGPAAGNTAAFGAALRQVLVKVSGRQAAGEQAVVASFGDPAALVQQFRRDAAGNLWAQFDPAAVRRGLARANLSAWGEDRPTTLVWLVWDSGAGELDLVPGSATGGTAGALRQQLLEAAEARGVPVMLPLRDAPDLAAVGAADAWGGSMDTIRRASARYPADVILVGRARLSPPGTADVRWTLLAGAQREEWSGGITEGPAGLAERLAARLASGPAGTGSIALAVSGVGTLDQYGALLAYLRGLDSVESVAVTGLAGDSLRLDLRLRTERGRFEQALALGRLLQPEPADEGTTTLRYRLAGQP